MAGKCKMECDKYSTGYPIHLVRKKIIKSVFEKVSRCNNCAKWFDRVKYLQERCPCCHYQLQRGKRHKQSTLSPTVARI